MGIIRRLGKIFLGFLFLICLFFLTTLYSLLNILSYGSLKEIASPLLLSKMNITQEQKEMLFLYLNYSCKDKEFTMLEFSENITIDCSKVKSLKIEEIEQFLIDSYLSNIYFKKYECNLLQCLQEKNIMYFLSFSFYEKISSYFIYSLIISIIFGVLYLLILENLQERLFSFSLIFLLIGINYFLIGYGLNIFETKIPIYIFSILKEKFLFLLYIFIAGLVLLVFSIILKIKKKIEIFYFKKRKK
ncbi:MAG: hypothetical protein QXD89_01585 [Candidatus Aenigmatarchaeota archaeon]